MNGNQKFNTTAWLPERDEPFFRVVRNLFSVEYLLGASTLLEGYDDEGTDTVPRAASPGRSRAHQPANGSAHQGHPA